MAKTLRLAIAGLGTIGVGVVQVLQKHAQKLADKTGRAIELVAVCDLDQSLDRGVDLSSYQWFGDALELAKDDGHDVFIEMMGGADGIALKSVETALESGKHVVTANKAMLAKHGTRLARLAEERGVSLNFEAAVGGGIPVIKAMRESLIGNDVMRVYGIMNGTCNYILTKMQEEGLPFDQVLAEAQAAGYAEADPTFDIGGHDTAHKLAILTSLAFGTELAFDEIYLEGIEKISIEDIEAADELGYRIKLLGVAQITDTGIEQRVHPTMVRKHTAIAEIAGVTNCVAIDGDFVNRIMLVGPGAGAGPTASAIVGDIVDIARNIKMPPLLTKAADLKPYKRAQMRRHEGGYYIRLQVKDHPGAVASIATRMAEQEISLQSIVQKGPHMAGEEADEEKANMIPVILITHETTESAVRKALDAILSDGHVAEQMQMIRIESL